MTIDRQPFTRRQECELGRIRDRYGRLATARLQRGLVLVRVFGDQQLGEPSVLLMGPDGRILRGRMNRTAID